MKKSVLLIVCFLSLSTGALCQEMTPNQLRAEFQENEFAFEDKYQGKEIIITGKVDDVGRQIISGQPKVSFNAGGLYFIHCRLPEGAKSSLAKIRPGDKMSLRAIYDTKSVTTLFFDCELP